MQIFAVGGSVRDKLLGKPIADQDYVVIGATHDDMIAAGFERVGADFPVYLHPETKEEYALARTERKNGKGYLGFEVDFDPTITLEEDLERRDLRLNSIAMTLSGEIIDPFNGVQDIRDKILRHTSPAFSEDPLRVIRLARFYARFEDFTIALETAHLATQLVESGELEHLSRERFWAEMEKTLKQTKRLDRFFTALDNFGVMDKVSFFRDVFGTPWCPRQSYLIPLITLNLNDFNIPDDLKLAAFVSLVANNAEQKSSQIPAKAKKLNQAIQALRASGMNTPEKLLGFFKSHRAFTEGNMMDLIINVHRLGEHIGMTFSVNSITLGRAWLAAAAITSVNYQDLNGNDIGNAIKGDRLEAIDMELRTMKTYTHPDVVDEITRELIRVVDAERPDKIKADYERVMREGGLLPQEPKIWVPSESK